MSDSEERERNRNIRRLQELFLRRAISRRQFLAGMAALGVSAAGAGLLAACGAAAPTPTAVSPLPTATKASAPAPTPTSVAVIPFPDYKADPVVVAAAGKIELIKGDWGGSWGKCFLDHVTKPWMEETGVKVIEVTPVEYGKLKAMVQSGVLEYWFTVDSTWGDRAALEGLLDPLDYNMITNSKDIYDQKLVKPYTVPTDIEAIVLGYQKSKWPDPAKAPKTWKDFWDIERFPGPRALRVNRPAWVMPIALMADGVEKITYPLDIDRAFKSLSRIKPHIKVWYDSPAQAQQLLIDGEVVMTDILNGRAGSLILEGANLDISWENALAYSAPWIIVKGAPHQDLINRYINFAIAPKPAAGVANCTGYGSPNVKSVGFMDPAVGKLLPSNPDNLKFIQTLDLEWWATNEGPVQERFAAWLAG